MSKSHTYSIILIDLDGTLIDSKLGILNSVQYALEKYGIHQNKKTLLHFIGPPLNISFKQFFGFDDAKAMEAVMYYREYFLTKGMYENTLIDGWVELLTKLKADGQKIYVATSKPTFFAEKIIIHHNIDHLFEAVVGSDLDLSNADKELIIGSIIKRHTKVPKSSFVMIGDREHDIIGAQANGIDSIAVTFEPTWIEELKRVRPTHIANSMIILEQLLTKTK